MIIAFIIKLPANFHFRQRLLDPLKFVNTANIVWNCRTSSPQVICHPRNNSKLDHETVWLVENRMPTTSVHMHICFYIHMHLRIPAVRFHLNHRFWGSVLFYCSFFQHLICVRHHSTLFRVSFVFSALSSFPARLTLQTASWLPLSYPMMDTQITRQLAYMWQIRTRRFHPGCCQ